MNVIFKNIFAFAEPHFDGNAFHLWMIHVSLFKTKIVCWDSHTYDSSCIKLVIYRDLKLRVSRKSIFCYKFQRLSWILIFKHSFISRIPVWFHQKVENNFATSSTGKILYTKNVLIDSAISQLVIHKH